MRKNAFALFILLAPCLAMAQATGGPSPMALHVPDSIGYVVGNHVYVNQPDNLDLLIEANRLDTATALAVHGPVSGEDLRYLRLLCGGEYDQRANLIRLQVDTLLSDLDLTDARLVPSPHAGVVIYIYSHVSSMLHLKHYVNSEVAFPNFAMYGCKSLRKLTLPPNLTRIGWEALSQCSIDSIVIPEGVDTLAGNPIYECPRLRYVSLPATLRKSQDSFKGCDSIERIACHAEVPPAMHVDEDSLDKDLPFHDSCTLLVPQGCVERYRNADGWKYFANIIEKTEP